jgi:hypothetical protein
MNSNENYKTRQSFIAHVINVVGKFQGSVQAM